MKKLYLLLFAVFTGVHVSAQSVVFVYDDAGNRVKRLSSSGECTPRDPENPSGIMAGLNYHYFESAINNTWCATSNLNGQTPVKTGTVANFSLAPRNRDEQFGFEFTGYLDVTTQGEYTFYLQSDDASRFLIGSQTVVSYEGCHGMTPEQTGTICLKAGRHAIKALLAQGGGERGLEIRWSGPGISKQLIPDNRLFRSGSCTPPPAPSIDITTGSTACASTPNTSVTLTATGCSGTVTWFRNGSQVATGSTTHTTNEPGTYTATCTSGGCTSGVSNTVNVAQTSGCGGGNPPSGNCYTLSFRGENPKYISNHNGILKVKAADNSASQIWKKEDVDATYFKLVSQGSTNGTKIDYVLGVRNQGSSEENLIDLQTSASGDHQLWKRTELQGSGNENFFKIERKNTAYRISSYRGWGQGNLSDGESDLGIYSDPGDVYGWNKWKFDPVACPGCTPPSAPSISKTEGTTVCVANSQKVTLTAANCSGTVTWYRNGAPAGTGATLQTDIAGNYTATCTVGGCASAHSGTVVVQETSGCGGSGQCTSPRDPENPSGTTAGLNYRYFESATDGNWCATSSLNGQTPVKTGTVTNFSLSPRNKDEHFGFEFTGYLDVTTQGEYTFYLQSDDASRFLIGSQTVVSYEGCHGMTPEQTGTICLKAGRHAIKALLAQGGGERGLEIRWSGPGISKQLIADNRLFRSGSCTPPSAPSIDITTGSTACPSTPNTSVTLTATGCSGTVTWFRNGSQVATGSAIHTTNIPGVYTATCTSGGCVSGASNTVNVAQTSGCGDGNSINITLSIWRAGEVGVRTKIQDLNNGDNIPISALNGGQANWFIDIAGGQISSSPGTGNYNHVSLYLNGNGYTNQGWGPENVTTGAGSPPYGLHGRDGGSSPSVGNGYQLTGKVFFNSTELASKTVTFNIVSDACSFTPSVTASTTTPAASSSFTLTAGCSGSGCSGVTHTWSGNGISGTQNPKTVTAPTTPGSYTYTVTTSKSGCSNKTANVTITVPSPASNCYTLSFKGENPKYISNHNGIVKVKEADNSNSQIWKMEQSGGHFKLVSQGSTNGTKIGYVLGVRNQGGSENDIIDLQASTSGDHQLWSRTSLTGVDSLRFKIERKGTAYRIGSVRNWGQGNLSDGESDLALVSDPGDVFGFYKWTFTQKTCPGSGSRLSPEAASFFETERYPSDLTIAPNPNSGEFQAAFNLTHNREATLSVIDMSGKTWYEKNVKGEGLQKETIHLPRQASGVFIVLLKSQDGIISRKVIVTR